MISASHQSGTETSEEAEEKEELPRVTPLPRVTLHGAGLMALAMATSRAEEVGGSDLSPVKEVRSQRAE